MKPVSLSFLAVLVLWAVSVVSADIATNKITNRKIILGAKILLGACIAQAFVTYLGYKGDTPVFLLWEFYPMLARHALWSALAGIILWYAEIWPAGDAKFFILVSASLPVVNSQIRNFPNYLFLSLLVNIFVLASIFAVCGFISSGMRSASPGDFLSGLWTDMRKRLSSLGSGKSRLTALAYLFNMIFVFLMQQIFAFEAAGALGRLFSRVEVLYFFIFILWGKIGGVFKGRRLFYLTTCCYLVYFFAGYFFFYDRLALMIITAIVNVLKFSLLLFFGRFMLEFLMEKKDLIYVGAEELSPGMVLSSKESARLKANPVFEGAFDDSFRDGLVAEQVELLRSWLKKLPLENAKMEMVKGRPFALWISAGAAISLLFDRNLVHLLK
ncbi:MAG TPA: hypothetical protein DCL44_04925 [Elusimicrobia bacterium]|nr:hypothetical protein [Elusimicrobiota bacterium]